MELRHEQPKTPKPPRNSFRKTLPAPGCRRVRPWLEALEERLMPSTYTVTDPNDSAGSASDVTLRYAINAALSTGDQNAVINFSSSLTGQTISPYITDHPNNNGGTAFDISEANITIDGSNAPGLILDGRDAER
jgi:hypothetical protein